MTARLHQEWPAWIDAEGLDGSLAPVRRMLFVSAALHLAIMALVAGLRWSPRIERLTATQVTLVSLPQAPPAPVEPPPQAVQPATPPPPVPPRATEPKTRPSAPIAAKAPAPPSVKPSAATKAADNRLREALQGIERPPEAPRTGEYRPAPKPEARGPVDKLPDVPADTKTREKPPSLSDVARELEALQRPQPKTAVASKPKAVPRPVTAIQAPGADSSLGRYLSLVQAKISEQWVAPPVDLTAKTYQVVIKFRLHRSGQISDVEIEHASGNGYYDDAGKRAVLSVSALPSFPPSVTETVLETHFTFTVGEEAG